MQNRKTRINFAKVYRMCRIYFQEKASLSLVGESLHNVYDMYQGKDIDIVIGDMDSKASLQNALDMFPGKVIDIVIGDMIDKVGANVNYLRKPWT